MESILSMVGIAIGRGRISRMYVIREKSAYYILPSVIIFNVHRT